MSEVELYLVDEGENCTIYTLQFLRDSDHEFEKFEKLLKQGVEGGSVSITESNIVTDNIFEL